VASMTRGGLEKWAARHAGAALLFWLAKSTNISQVAASGAMERRCRERRPRANSCWPARSSPMFSNTGSTRAIIWSRPRWPNASTFRARFIRASLKRLAKESVVEARRNQGFFLLKGWDRLDGGVDRRSAEHRRHALPPNRTKPHWRENSGTDHAGRPDQSFIARIGAHFARAAKDADEGIVTKNKGHGWTFLPAINTELSVRNSYDFRRTLEPSGILLDSFRVQPTALDRLRAAHLALLSRADTASGTQLFYLDTEFHETIASFTHNSFFIQAIQQQNRLRRLMEYAAMKTGGACASGCANISRSLTRSRPTSVAMLHS